MHKRDDVAVLRWRVAVHLLEHRAGSCMRHRGLSECGEEQCNSSTAQSERKGSDGEDMYSRCRRVHVRAERGRSACLSFACLPARDHVEVIPLTQAQRAKSRARHASSLVRHQSHGLRVVEGHPLSMCDSHMVTPLPEPFAILASYPRRAARAGQSHSNQARSMASCKRSLIYGWLRGMPMSSTSNNKRSRPRQTMVIESFSIPWTNAVIYKPESRS